MEGLSELENRIIKEYVEKLISKINAGLISFNKTSGLNLLPPSVSEVVVKYLNAGYKDGVHLLIGKEGGMIETSLIPVVKELAIKEFLEKVKKV